MAVNPGFGGRSFLGSQLEKIRRIRTMIGERPIRLEVDGGITRDNAAAVAAAGAGTLVAGSAVFRGKGRDDYAANIAAIRVAAESGLACRSPVMPRRAAASARRSAEISLLRAFSLRQGG